MPSFGLIVIALWVGITAVLYAPASRKAEISGAFRNMDDTANVHGHEVKIIPNTVQCEDVHHHLDSGLLFAACQGKNPLDRLEWFPPLAIFDDPRRAGNGGIFVIDPKTFKSTELKITGGFKGPFATHGIDVITDPSDKNVVHIFAVNHVPNPNHFVPGSQTRNVLEQKAASRVELFTHEIGSETIKWRRSVKNDLVFTPNDVLATSPTSFYVTNDHYYREGAMRTLEDVLTASSAPWTDIIHVTITDPDLKTDPTKGQVGERALHELHNNNGLGRSSSSAFPNEILIVDASGGNVYRAEPNKDNKKLKIIERISLNYAIDNPSWFADPYANATHDASGYVLAGLYSALDLHAVSNPKTLLPTHVLHIKAGDKGKIQSRESHSKWERNLVWVDTGKTIRSASAAVIVAIDPKENGGKKQGWLFITGFVSDAMVASRIDL